MFTSGISSKPFLFASLMKWIKRYKDFGSLTKSQKG